VNGPIRRLAVGIFAAMGCLLLSVTWFQVIRADDLKNDPRNPRPALTERGKERGLIISSDGVVLARSVPVEGTRGFERSYPEGEVFAHSVGYSSFILGDNGLEASRATELRSRRDVTISDLLAAVLGRDLRPRSIETTLDSRLQRAAFEALGDNIGAIVALDPATGAILASVSTPSFNPELLLGPDTADNWAELLADPASPLSDRATRELYAPGSTFKTAVAASAIDTGVANPGTSFADPGAFPLPGSTATISNAWGGPCNDGVTAVLHQAFTRSCNTIFADLAIQTGAEPIGDTVEAMGWNQPMDFEWTIPNASWLTEQLSRDPAALGQSGIGERDVRATPLHMAMIAAAVANGGQTMAPYLVERVFDADGVAVETTIPAQLARAMSQSTAATMSLLMERVVTEGTGRGAALPGVRVGGKTGTASGPGGFPNLWFIGFAPVESPTIALAVFVEGSPRTGSGASGGAVAAPIAAEVLRAWLEMSQ
jgi:penicillin-binding protein A